MAEPLTLPDRVIVGEALWHALELRVPQGVAEPLKQAVALPLAVKEALLQKDGDKVA